MVTVWGFGGAYSLGFYREKKMNGFGITLSLLNLLIIPGVLYIVKLEKRLIRIEAAIKDLCNGKRVILD